MALVSPGIQVTVIDESQYLPTAVGTVPFVVITTAENKTINGVVAPGTIKANAGKVYGITSQRELASIFGIPAFRRSVADTPLHADELNEYGLMTAYSALGLGNRAWIVRADINTNDLVGTTVRPKGSPANNTNWFDISGSDWGIFEFDDSISTPGVPFIPKTPIVITSSTSTFGGNTTPLPNIGNKGDYAVVVFNDNNYVYYKTDSNFWESVGSSNWANSIPVVTSVKSNSTAFATPISTTHNFTINGNTVSFVSTVSSMSGVVSAIAAISEPGVTASVTATGRLQLNITTASNGGFGNLVLVDGTGNVLAKLGIPVGTYNRASVSHGTFAQTPAWRRTDPIPRPAGSVWIKTSLSGGGINLVFKRYNSTTSTWATQATPVYGDGFDAVYNLDSLAGGLNIPVGTVFVKYYPTNDGRVGYKFYTQRVSGVTKVIGSNTSPIFSSGDQFTMTVSQPGTATPISSGTITVGGTTASAFVTAVAGAGIPNVAALVESTGAVSFTHRSGGIITLTSTTNTPIANLGITTSTLGVTPGIVPGTINLTNFAESTVLGLQVSASTPNTAPADGRMWYYDDATVIDILISDSTGWKGYRNVMSDARGYNLSLTDPLGVIVSASEPTTQQNGTSALVSGDLWLDSSNLENFPSLYRYDAISANWNLIDNTDHISLNGIIFADARWDGSGTTDPITGAYPSTVSLLTSNYIDLDAPDFRLYPRGTLLFNTRRSGYNVKKYVVNYFNASAFPGAVLPTKTSTWVSQIGYDSAGKPYMGHKAQRHEIVSAMKAAVDGNLNIREEGYNFNLLVAPGYPELITNLIALNNDRANTGFVIGDSPMTLRATINDVTSWSNTLTTSSPYVAIYYPSALTTDLNGNQIAVPASHMMLRTFMYNDNVAYQWFAPAGTRRGLVDNALALGYVNAETGNFITSGINNQLRDSLYDLAINPLTFINGTGIVVYGQKTRSPIIAGGASITSALDRVNVARLVNYLRVLLTTIGNQFLFEPNDKITRDQLKQLIESLLNDLVAKRGIYDYIVVCDETNNTPARIARNELYADIAIEPVKAVEFIYIPVRLKNPGTISGTNTNLTTT